MKDKLKKCKRPRVDWVKTLKEVGDVKLIYFYYHYLECHSRMSPNRCAFNVLKLHYSTTAIKNYRYHPIPLGAPVYKKNITRFFKDGICYEMY